MKTIKNIFIRIWLIIITILFLVALILSTIGMLWIPYWILTGKSMPPDVIKLFDKITPTEIE